MKTCLIAVSLLSSVLAFAEAAPKPAAAPTPAPAAARGPALRPAHAKLSPAEREARRRALLERRKRMHGMPRRGISGVSVSDFGTTQNGEKAKRYRVMGAGGMVADFSDCGARLVRLYAPDRYGNLTDVTVGFNDVSGYEKYDRNFNATVGRFANRIAGGTFKLDGTTYQLPLNWGTDAKCCLHGGTNAMNIAVWKARPMRQPHRTGVQFTYKSPDGDQGFPGALTVTVTHWITADNVWAIDYEAKVEGKACPINLTNHAYFNLKGIGSGDANDHVVQIFAKQYTPVNAGMIPTGEIADVAGTPFDFLTPHAVGERVNADHPQLKLGKGYDHNWVLSSADGSLAKAAVVSEPKSGRFVEVWTTEPGLQFYGGNVMSGGKGLSKPVPNKTGGTLPWRGALAFETQHFPDSPNHANFPNTVLKPGETFTSHTEYRFGAK